MAVGTRLGLHLIFLSVDMQTISIIRKSYSMKKHFDRLVPTKLRNEAVEFDFDWPKG